MNEMQLLESIGQMLDEKLDQKLDEKLGPKLDEKIDRKLEKLDQKLDEKLTPIYHRLDCIGTRLDNVEGRLSKLELENENIIIPNIQKLAEGYKPLYNKVLCQGIMVEKLCESVDVLEVSTKRNSQDIVKLKSLLNANP